ncbi:GAF domain-containing protein [Actinoplanes cyaneus]|uniref:GAF domain-containing protein n=1 Tax=Actinoplanes cyaneus TaxID=52696 RepID=A0A919IE14_9ACTN|nr:ANTAR domain-containing protein [Actinoplanes cyaneus]GID63843.1 GAF domain-containing protein [Actinoplanes cyaneus]
MLRLVTAHGPDVESLCSAGLTGLAEIGGLGVTMMTPEMQHVRYASDAVSARVEQLQFLLGEGPCRDAYAQAGPVLAEDLRATVWHERWPAFAPAALEAGARAVFALPLGAGWARIGAIDLYRDGEGALAGPVLADALVLADAVAQLLLAETVAVAEAQSPAYHAGRDHLLQRAAVHQATGMISVQLGVTVEEALVRLRAHAYACSRDLDEVAADVLARRMRFDNLDDEGDRAGGYR